MIKKVFVILIYLFIYYSSSSQTIGQTKKFIINKFEACKIEENRESFLSFNCDGINHLFIFDEDGLCSTYMLEVAVADWNSFQVDLLFDNGKYLGKIRAPLPQKINSRVDALIYSDEIYDYMFYKCDFEGNEKSTTKGLSINRKI